MAARTEKARNALLHRHIGFMTKAFALVVLCGHCQLATFIRHKEESEIRIFADTDIRVRLHDRFIVIADVYLLDEISRTKTLAHQVALQTCVHGMAYHQTPLRRLAGMDGIDSSQLHLPGGLSGGLSIATDRAATTARCLDRHRVAEIAAIAGFGNNVNVVIYFKPNAGSN